MFTKVSTLTQNATGAQDHDNSERLIESVSDTEKKMDRFSGKGYPS
jgi:hypothetical protein